MKNAIILQALCISAKDAFPSINTKEKLMDYEQELRATIHLCDQDNLERHTDMTLAVLFTELIGAARCALDDATEAGLAHLEDGTEKPEFLTFRFALENAEKYMKGIHVKRVFCKNRYTYEITATLAQWQRIGCFMNSNGKPRDRITFTVWPDEDQFLQLLMEERTKDHADAE